MSDENPDVGDTLAIDRAGLDNLIEALRDSGYTVIGPTARDGAILYEEIQGCRDLPAGWAEEQEAATYRLHRRDDDALFGYTVGPQSWKRFLHEPVLTLWKARRGEDGIRVELPDEEPPRYAFLGVRACELSAIAIQDRVFLEGPYVDRAYAERRERAFLIAVNCGRAASTCFCTSMSTGPRARSGFDLALTEMPDPERHLFVVEIGSERGAEIVAGLGCEPATRAEIDEAAEIVENTAASMGREISTDGVRELLQENLEHPRWDDVAERCLSCANCTMVCPTCFCSTVEDVTDLSGTEAQRKRRWDSCFTLDFSYLGGLPTRASTKSRYRQWLTHKLSTWHDQFDSSGCVGCGRCITWCPVGIDLTREVEAIRADDRREKEATT